MNRLLIEAGAHIKKEYYISFVVDRESRCVVMMASESGGMAIEDVAAENPEAILKEYIAPVSRPTAWRMLFIWSRRWCRRRRLL